MTANEAAWMRIGCDQYSGTADKPRIATFDSVAYELMREAVVALGDDSGSALAQIKSA